MEPACEDELVQRIAAALATRLGRDWPILHQHVRNQFLDLARVAFTEVHKSGRLIPPQRFFDILAAEYEKEKAQ